MIGSAQFESLVELISYYKRHPLYHKVKLVYPVNDDFVRGVGPVSYVHLLRPCLYLRSILCSLYSVQIWADGLISVFTFSCHLWRCALH